RRKSSQHQVIRAVLLAGQILLTDGKFGIARLQEIGFLQQYEGPATLDRMKSAANYFSGSEKKGCHEIAVGNPAVIDCEITFPGRMTLGNGKEINAARVDLASLEAVGTEAARLVFWEAKHFSNGDLRAAGKQPAQVVYQVKGYESYLAANLTKVLKSYQRVAENLMAINGIRHDTLVAKVSTGKQLTLGDPSVGLIIFGFDEAQRNDPVWKCHLTKIQDQRIRVLARGDPKSIRL
ncbi:MAG: hypothetical protein WB760_31120, partial [Xanthobacteraceae bacterium]